MMLNNNQLLFQGLSQKADENTMVGDDETLEKTGKVKIYFFMILAHFCQFAGSSPHGHHLE